MINISTLIADKKLSILLPNTNKVLTKVLASATESELESITTQKDLKSIINSFLKDSSLNTKADKALLNLVKNNPTFKELSNTNETIKQLLSTVKSDKNLLHVEKIIQKFLPEIKELNNSNIKSTLENSGVFLESKLKNIKNPIQRLNTILNDLSSIVKQSKQGSKSTILAKINEINNSSTMKENLGNASVITQKEPVKALQVLVENIKQLSKKLEVEIKSANPISTEKFSEKLVKLEVLVSKIVIQDEKVINKEKLVPKDKIILPKENITTTLQEDTKKVQDIKIPVLQEAIKDINMTLKSSFTESSKGFLDVLTKIFNVLKTIEQTATTPQNTTKLILDEKIPQKIDKIILDIKTEIQKADPLFSKDVKVLLRELYNLNAPQKLSSQENIKDILNNDLKAVILKTREELALQPASTSQTEALKHIDKLALSIDYYQLVSHLSNSTSLYLPISWDEMKEGNISIKKVDKDKFYCDIELNLEEYKELRVRLTVFETNQLNIHISSDSSKLKKLMGESMQDLRSALIDMQITPRDIRFTNYTNNTAHSSYVEVDQKLDMGFEVKG